LTPEASFENEKEPPYDYPPSDDYAPARSRWQENHGNLLMVFVGLIFLIGSLVLIYRQTRFVPPRFPDSDMIEPPAIANDPATPPPIPEDVVLIRVIGAGNDVGSIKIAIYENEESFSNPDSAFATSTLALENNEAIWLVPVARLPGKIAIAAYHDENEDGQLTLNRLGIPSERYGFSRNARGLTGPPSFQQIVIDRPEGGETLNLFIR
jgi:uncharacterized protein (DUF2141 family)